MRSEFGSTSRRSDSRIARYGIAIIVLSLVGVVAAYARRGTLSPRIANPNVVGAPRPIEFLFGWSGPVWLGICEWGAAIGMVWLLVGCLRAWRRQPGHPNVLMTIACTAIAWLDPIMNWSVFAVYNPQLWRLPEDWPLARLSPSVEPLLVVGYALFYFAPFFPAISMLRRLQAHASSTAFVWRHPLWSLAGIVLIVGFIFDALLEIFCVHTGLYIYSQVIPWGSVGTGTTFQFPLMIQSTLICMVMIPAAVLSYRDDTGRSQAARLAQRMRWLPRHPTLATFLMMFSFLNVAYVVYGSCFALIRLSGAATAVACPNPFPEAKQYDPQGYFEREGEPGPYHEGFWTLRSSSQRRP